MIILICIKKVKIALLVSAFFILCGFGIHLWNLSPHTSVVITDEVSKEKLTLEIQEMFHLRNKALLEEHIDLLGGLYNKNVRNGLWAYEHEIKKLKYLHTWSAKQHVKFTKIDSHIIVRYVKEKGNKLSLNLLVSTEYQYHYEDTPQISNSFRIGTYHALDIMPHDEGWLITKEWYTDPFADSLSLDEYQDQQDKELILSGESKDLSSLNKRRVNAIAYADQYCGAASLPEYRLQYNAKYKNHNPLGGDCANFASQMLFEGGKFRKNGSWNYERGEGSKAWLNAHAFNDYMLYSGRASLIAHGGYDKVFKSSYKLLPGDYVAYEKKGKVTHISVVTGIDSKSYALVNSHNSDRYRVPWDLGWSNKGIKFYLVRVHY